jgi:type IX secretion system PorP/SprF family membrane protein
MKRIVSLICLSVVAGFSLLAQQDPLSTMFMTNPFVLNPAIAGTNKYFQVTSSNRFQWVGLSDAPITNSISVYGPMVKYPMGWGGTIYYDVCGPVSTGTIHGSYAYQYNINDVI